MIIIQNTLKGIKIAYCNKLCHPCSVKHTHTDTYHDVYWLAHLAQPRRTGFESQV